MIKLCPNFQKGDYVTIRERLQGIDWEELLQGEFLSAYAIFIDTLKKGTDGCIPDHKNAKNRKNIYLTDKALRMKDLKNRLWQNINKLDQAMIQLRF